LTQKLEPSEQTKVKAIEVKLRMFKVNPKQDAMGDLMQSMLSMINKSINFQEQNIMRNLKFSQLIRLKVDITFLLSVKALTSITTQCSISREIIALILDFAKAELLL
jgi:hypothetical protein